MKLKMAIDI